MCVHNVETGNQTKQKKNCLSFFFFGFLAKEILNLFFDPFFSIFIFFSHIFNTLQTLNNRSIDRLIDFFGHWKKEEEECDRFDRLINWFEILLKIQRWKIDCLLIFWIKIACFFVVVIIVYFVNILNKQEAKTPTHLHTQSF